MKTTHQTRHPSCTKANQFKVQMLKKTKQTVKEHDDTDAG